MPILLVPARKAIALLKTENLKTQIPVFFTFRLCRRQYRRHHTPTAYRGAIKKANPTWIVLPFFWIPAPVAALANTRANAQLAGGSRRAITRNGRQTRPLSRSEENPPQRPAAQVFTPPPLARRTPSPGEYPSARLAFPGGDIAGRRAGVFHLSATSFIAKKTRQQPAEFATTKELPIGVDPWLPKCLATAVGHPPQAVWPTSSTSRQTRLTAR